MGRGFQLVERGSVRFLNLEELGEGEELETGRGEGMAAGMGEEAGMDEKDGMVGDDNLIHFAPFRHYVEYDVLFNATYFCAF